MQQIYPVTEDAILWSCHENGADRKSDFSTRGIPRWIDITEICGSTGTASATHTVQERKLHLLTMLPDTTGQDKKMTKEKSMFKN
jgi:hypothetical protein